MDDVDPSSKLMKLKPMLNESSACHMKTFTLITRAMTHMVTYHLHDYVSIVSLEAWELVLIYLQHIRLPVMVLHQDDLLIGNR